MATLTNWDEISNALQKYLKRNYNEKFRYGVSRGVVGRSGQRITNEISLAGQLGRSSTRVVIANSLASYKTTEPQIIWHSLR